MVRTEKELGEALKEEKSEIEIEGDLARKVIRIKATGKVAWAIAIGAIGVAVVAVLTSPATGGAHGVIGVGLTAPVAVGVLGVSATTAAVSIAVAAGGVGALKTLRSYQMVKLDDDHIILKK
ncbi:MAG: hypothetical protein IJS14_05605 [Lentisphaeria bacterium]|nr:hypothetical protein [Lentisphaeria bacterium]